MSTFAHKSAFSYLSDDEMDIETTEQQDGQREKENDVTFDKVATQTKLKKNGNGHSHCHGKNKKNIGSTEDDWETIADSTALHPLAHSTTKGYKGDKHGNQHNNNNNNNNKHNSHSSTKYSNISPKGIQPAVSIVPTPSPAQTVTQQQQPAHHPLNRIWKVWSHLPHNPDWSLQSYSLLNTLTTVEQTVATIAVLPENMVKGCMLFVVRDGIAPMWEDPHNIGGGYFSYKIYNKNVCEVWRDVVYSLVGETLSQNARCMNSITGVEISPKKNFCIIKIWMSTCEFQAPNIISSELKGLPIHGCLFSKFNDKAETSLLQQQQNEAKRQFNSVIST